MQVGAPRCIFLESASNGRARLAAIQSRAKIYPGQPAGACERASERASGLKVRCVRRTRLGDAARKTSQTGPNSDRRSPLPFPERKGSLRGVAIKRGELGAAGDGGARFDNESDSERARDGRRLALQRGTSDAADSDGAAPPRAGVVSISSFAFAFTFTFTFSIGFAFAAGSAFAFAFAARAHATDQSTVSRPSPCAIRTRSLLLPRGAPCERSPAAVSLPHF